MEQQDPIIEAILEHPEIELEALAPEIDFRDDLGLDSLVIAEIAIDLEDKLDIRFPDNAISSIRTVEDVMNIAREQLSQ